DLAAEAFAEYLAVFPEDTCATRMRGITLLMDSKAAQGIELIATAYQTDIALASSPLDKESFPAPAELFSRAVNVAASNANRTGSAKAWLAACVVAQTQGRMDAATKMLAKAQEAGLQPDLVREIKASLGH